MLAVGWTHLLTELYYGLVEEFKEVYVTVVL